LGYSAQPAIGGSSKPSERAMRARNERDENMDVKVLGVGENGGNRVALVRLGHPGDPEFPPVYVVALSVNATGTSRRETWARTDLDESIARELYEQALAEFVTRKVLPVRRRLVRSAEPDIAGDVTRAHVVEDGDTWVARYIVEEGDTWAQIADRYGVSLRELVELNGLRWPFEPAASWRPATVGAVVRIPATEPQCAADPIAAAPPGANGPAEPQSSEISHD
jgi:LysM domain